MKDRHRRAFQAFAEQAEDCFTSIREVILFGSVARDSHGRYSDVDVLIVVDTLQERDAIEDLAFATATTYGVSITPVIITHKRWNEDTPFHRTVRDEGVPYVEH